MILSLIIAAGALAISSGTFTEAAPPANDSAANAPASPVPTVTATETIAVTPMQTAAQSNFQPSPAVASAESESAAVAWLGLIENEEAEVSRQAAAPVMRDRHSDGLWAIGMALRNNNYGVVLERDLLAVNRRAAPAGSAASEIEVLIFETDFSNSPGAQEVLVMHRIDGRWMVADYDLSEAGDCD
ncbi:hypothetical protein BMF35_a2066 [Aurantiacibacter gangjinensis]|nr:hypothetical protein BMF35_a2066 [Aurantiacibacter gangjinensis]